jgi:hypothetical protein
MARNQRRIAMIENKLANRLVGVYYKVFANEMLLVMNQVTAKVILRGVVMVNRLSNREVPSDVVSDGDRLIDWQINNMRRIRDAEMPLKAALDMTSYSGMFKDDVDCPACAGVICTHICDDRYGQKNKE